MNGLRLDPEQLASFVGTMFRHADARSFVSLRVFPQSGDDRPLIEAVRVGNHKNLVRHAVIDAAWAAQRGWVFCPPICSFASAYPGNEANVADGLCISAELDDGVDTLAAVEWLQGVLGDATVIVASGGQWIDAQGIVHPKLHAHWRLAQPARTPEQLAMLKQCRCNVAHLANGDPTCASVVHPLRWPGSLALQSRTPAGQNCAIDRRRG